MDGSMNAKIRDLAAEIESLKPKSPSESTLYNFAFGALYALERAIALEYPGQGHKLGMQRNVERLSMKRAREVKGLARCLREGRDMHSKDWLAGYFYNDALIRTDICYEQLARFMGKVKDKGERLDWKKLQARAIKGGLLEHHICPWWSKVHAEVRIIKHQSVHTTEGPGIKPTETLLAVEHLINGVKCAFHKHRV